MKKTYTAMLETYLERQRIPYQKEFEMDQSVYTLEEMIFDCFTVKQHIFPLHEGYRCQTDIIYDAQPGAIPANTLTEFARDLNRYIAYDLYRFPDQFAERPEDGYVEAVAYTASEKRLISIVTEDYMQPLAADDYYRTDLQWLINYPRMLIRDGMDQKLTAFYNRVVEKPPHEERNTYSSQ